MTLVDELDKIDSLFIDTAPIIYYIEAHPQFGPLVKDIVNFFQSGKYTFLRAMDAIQIAASLEAKADVFITNDSKLKQIEELKVIILRDYL